MTGKKTAWDVRKMSRMTVGMEIGLMDEKYRIDEDGVLRVRKTCCRRIGKYETFLAEREYEFPCMDMDGDVLFVLAVVGGWFGLHKFMTGHYLSGIFYALTCGLCGVYYVFDLAAMLFGNYVDERVSFEEGERGQIVQKRERYYNRPVTRRGAAIAGVVFAVGIAVLVVIFVYVPVYSAVSEAVMGIVPGESAAEFLRGWM